MCVPLIWLKQLQKNIFRLTCFILAHFLEIDEIFKSLSGIIQTHFSKLPHNNYNNILIWSKNSTNWYGNIFWIHNLSIKNQLVLVKWEHTLFKKGYVSHIVSDNSRQTLRFEYLITFLNLCELQIWIWPHTNHNIIKYEVTLPIVMQKYMFLCSS